MSPAKTVEAGDDVLGLKIAIIGAGTCCRLVPGWRVTAIINVAC
jgi:hypothetical protein